MKNLLFFVAGGLFILLVSSSSDKASSCRDEVKRLTQANESLQKTAEESQYEAANQAAIAAQQIMVANQAREEADMQRVAAERAQEEALIQAEIAVEAASEAKRKLDQAMDYKKQLEACQKNN